METTTEKVNTMALDPDQIAAANQLLKYLVDRGNKAWENVLSQGLTPTEMTQAVANVERACQAAGVVSPIGAVVGGTGVAKEEAGLPGEEGQIAVQVLKEQHRLVQCGRGRGKFLMVITAESIPAGTSLTQKERTGTVTNEKVRTNGNTESQLEETMRDLSGLVHEVEQRLNQLANDFAAYKEERNETQTAKISW